MTVGREMHATGWGGALAVLSFAGSWLFPLLYPVQVQEVYQQRVTSALLRGLAPNPLWQFDGLVDLLSPTSKG